MPVPLRIVSLLSSATEIVYALGLGDRLVGISHECDYPRKVAGKPQVTISHIEANQSSRQIDQQVSQLSQEQGALYSIDVPALVGLLPDLIITQAQCDVCAVRYDDVIAAVQSDRRLAHTAVLALAPNSLSDILNDIRRVGAATDSCDVAERYVQQLQSRIDRVRQRAAAVAIDERPRVCAIEWIDPIMLAGNWVPELIELAGGTSGITHAGEHSRYHDWHEIVQYDPQVLIVSPCGFDLFRSTAEAQSLLSHPNWNGLSAVIRRRAFLIDGNAHLNRSGPRMVDCLELLAYLFHPDRFASPRSMVQGRDWARLA